MLNKAKIVLLVWNAFQDFDGTYIAEQQIERISNVNFLGKDIA